jgi:hypothetical protein
MQRQASKSTSSPSSFEDMTGDQSHIGVSAVMVYAYAVLLRWLTPSQSRKSLDESIFIGFLEEQSNTAASQIDVHSVEYADRLKFNLREGWYEFRCDLKVLRSGRLVCLSDWLRDLSAMPLQPSAYLDAIQSYLLASDGGDLSSIAGDFPNQFNVFSKAVATIYARMIVGDSLLGLLEEMKEHKDIYAVGGMKTDCTTIGDMVPSVQNGKPLHYKPRSIPDESKLLKVDVLQDCIASVIHSEVASTQIIDIHTHLLPPSHGSLCLWGIDELLTYVCVFTCSTLLNFVQFAISPIKKHCFPLALLGV